MYVRTLAALVLLLAAPLARAASVEVRPADPLWESGRGALRAHFDLRFEHAGPDTLELAHIEVSALDARGRLLERRFVSGNGTAPSILTVPGRTLLPGEPCVVFNPFPVWDATLPVAALRYQLVLESATRAETLVTEVRPRRYEQQADLVLPLAGRVFVFDGHDALAHHRRVDPEFAPIRPLHVHNNSGRYAYDLSLVDEAGSMWRSDGRTTEDWYTWGVPVRAPGAGRVAVARDSARDWPMDGVALAIADIFRDPTVLMGNYIIVDHGHGEYSLLAHLQAGSVRVKPGETVKQGQEVARVGYTGSVFTVHLHYELRRGAGFDVEGLPSHFRGLSRVVGEQRVPLRDGFLDTGDIVESR